MLLSVQKIIIIIFGQANSVSIFVYVYQPYSNVHYIYTSTAIYIGGVCLNYAFYIKKQSLLRLKI